MKVWVDWIPTVVVEASSSVATGGESKNMNVTDRLSRNTQLEADGELEGSTVHDTKPQTNSCWLASVFQLQYFRCCGAERLSPLIKRWQKDTQPQSVYGLELVISNYRIE